MRKKKIYLKRKKKATPALTALIVAFALLFVVCGTMLAKKLLDYKKASDEYKDIKETAVISPAPEAESRYLTVDYASLKERNSDYIGWIDIPGTDISYPIVAASSYTEYIHTGFDGGYLYSGTIFTDYRCSEDWTSYNTIIYGHRMNDGSMFGTLKDYFDESYLDAHREIHIYTENEVRVYEVFSVYQAIAADESYTVSFADESEYQEWLKEIAARSVFDIGITPENAQSVIMLSTCKGGDNDNRNVAFAVLKEIVETEP